MKNVLLPIIVLSVSAGVCQAQPQTHTITTPGGVYNFSVDGVSNNPTINLTAGVTNIFQINTTVGLHPVVITTDPSVVDWYSGASPQEIYTGPISLLTPSTGFPTKLYYMCYFHAFYGEIDLSSAIGPMPPPNFILSIQVGTNVVMTSTGTNTTWLVVPQFSSNLLNGVWSPVPTYTNTFANGTNTTVFGRLDAICGPDVFLRLTEQPH